MRLNKLLRVAASLLLACAAGPKAARVRAVSHAAKAVSVSDSQADAAGVFNVRAFGAKGDGHTLDSPAVNRAVEAASAAGGGTVRFPAGVYRCFSIRLKSNITLYFEQGATILAADPRDGDSKYDAPEPNRWDKYTAAVARATRPRSTRPKKRWTTPNPSCSARRPPTASSSDT